MSSRPKFTNCLELDNLSFRSFHTPKQPSRKPNLFFVHLHYLQLISIPHSILYKKRTTTESSCLFSGIISLEFSTTWDSTKNLENLSFSDWTMPEKRLCYTCSKTTEWLNMSPRFTPPPRCVPCPHFLHPLVRAELMYF